jgi:inward rectifier potassium channel
MLRDVVTVEGYRFRRITDLELVRAEHPAFFLTWTLMHVIDDSSPLKASTEQSLRESVTTFMLTLSGTDDTTGQALMARAEFPSTDIRWNQGFKDVLEIGADGVISVDYNKFDEVESIPEPPGQNLPRD